uniref:limulus clotting factor C n=1 Tax=Strigamia maritima TaxID=126957 RepID=T1IZI7_STRMM
MTHKQHKMTGNMWLLCTILLIELSVSIGAFSKECGRGAFRHRQPRFSGKPESRIIGGNEVESNEWPWQVSIQLTHPYWGFVGHWCGGVLIDSNWVITAAHCLVNRLFNFPLPPVWTVVAGEHHLHTKNGAEQSRQVTRVIIHSNFREYHHDIALLKLSESMLLGGESGAVCLPLNNATRNMNLEGVRCVATGWGQKIQGHGNSLTLQKVEMPIVSNKICDKAYSGKYKIPIKSYHLCAGRLNASKGTCVGDSGGPLQCALQEGRWFLVGLTSFGSGCAKPGFPDVFTRLTEYTDWVIKSMKRYE